MVNLDLLNEESISGDDLLSLVRMREQGLCDWCWCPFIYVVEPQSYGPHSYGLFS